MTTAIQDEIGDILTWCADVIEGGERNRGTFGGSLKGVCGTHSNDPLVRDSSTITAATNGTDSAFAATESNVNHAKLVRAGTGLPSIYMLCASSGNGLNTGAARALAQYGAGIYTMDAAYPANIAQGDTFVFREGFAHVPNGVDLFEEVPSGLDRRFELRALPGRELNYYGAGRAHYTTTLDVRLRLLKMSKQVDWVAAALQNSMIIRNTLTTPANRDGTYVRAILPGDGAPEIEVSDKHKVVVIDRLQLIYRVNTGYR